MPTVMTVLDAPLQSWGVTEQGTLRPTGTHPSKSGVVGMIGAALGLDRYADLSEITALRYAVRVDRPGVEIVDLHTARMVEWSPDSLLEALHGFPSSPKYGDSTRTWRGYLSDATFTVALSGPGDLVARVAEALRMPVHLLYLGRRGCPAPPLEVAVVDCDTPVDALIRHPYVPDEADRRPVAGKVVIHADADAGGEGPVFAVNDEHRLRAGRQRRFRRRMERTVVVSHSHSHSHSHSDSHSDSAASFEVLGL